MQQVNDDEDEVKGAHSMYSRSVGQSGYFSANDAQSYDLDTYIAGASVLKWSEWQLTYQYRTYNVTFRRMTPGETADPSRSVVVNYEGATWITDSVRDFEQWNELSRRMR